jgi:uncharacterized protein YkwD
VTSNRVLALAACLAVTAVGAASARGADDPHAALLAPSGACGAAADRTPLDPPAARQAMLCLTNYARARSGVRPLAANALLDTAGRSKLTDDVSCGEFSHTPCGRPFADVFAPYLARAGGYRIGENIALGGAEFATPRSTMDGWLHSAGHRANILAPEFRELGVGYVPSITFLGSPNVSLWSQEFGSRSTSARAAAAARPTASTPARTRPRHARMGLPLAATPR